MILECKKCEAQVNAELIASYEHGDILGPVIYSFLKCPQCQTPLLAEENSFGVDRLYPPQDSRVNPNLPVPLRTAYEEALACFKSKAYTALLSCAEKHLRVFALSMGLAGVHWFLH